MASPLPMGRRWLAAAVALPAVALALIAADPSDAAHQLACQRVQALVGGHGLGASVMPAWCEFAFDPRAQQLCSCPVWPVPGGPCFCPDHSATVLPLVERAPAGAVPVLRPRERR